MKILENSRLSFVSIKYHLFIKLLILWNMFDIFMCTLNYKKFWGEDAIYLGTKYFGVESSNLFLKAINLLNMEIFSSYAYVFIILQLSLGSILLLRKESSKLLSLLFYLLTSNLHVPMAYGLDGGNNLANILFLYFLMFDWSGVKFLSEDLKKKTTLIAFTVSVLQVCLVYLVAGFSKVKGDLWLNGTALYYIMQIPQYSTIYITDLLLENDLMLVIANYVTIIFQLYFPCIMFKKTNRLWVIMGIGLHIMISLVLGLLQFGIFMSIVYVLFLDEKWLNSLMNTKDKVYAKFERLFTRPVLG